MVGNNIVSKILFILSSVLFVLFALTLFFGGQKLGGAMYFVFFLLQVAFAFLDRKYNSNFIDLYRYSIYLADIANIVAVGTIIYYGHYRGLMISTVSVLGISLFVDLFSKNRRETRRLESILVSILNCVLMLSICPFFFEMGNTLVVAICSLVVSSIVLVLKLILAFVPFKWLVVDKKIVDKNQAKQDIEGNSNDLEENEIEQKVSVARNLEHNLE